MSAAGSEGKSKASVAKDEFVAVQDCASDDRPFYVGGYSASWWGSTVAGSGEIAFNCGDRVPLEEILAHYDKELEYPPDHKLRIKVTSGRTDQAIWVGFGLLYTCGNLSTAVKNLIIGILDAAEAKFNKAYGKENVTFEISDEMRGKLKYRTGNFQWIHLTKAEDGTELITAHTLR